jgi:hypothetical protein
MYIPCEASSWTLLHQNRKLSSRISLQNQLFCLCRLPAVLCIKKSKSITSTNFVELTWQHSRHIYMLWLTILPKMNKFRHTVSEELRSQSVTHGRKTITMSLHRGAEGIINITSVLHWFVMGLEERYEFRSLLIQYNSNVVKLTEPKFFLPCSNVYYML